MREKLTPAAALVKARAWCARQERCHQETRNKLRSWGFNSQKADQVLTQLITEGFLNEARFAEHFAISKARQKGWGPRKIGHELKAREVSAPCIAMALRAVDADEQLDHLRRRVEQRWAKEPAADLWTRRQRVIRHFLRKGFGTDEVTSILDALIGRS
ncbi:MAG: RecX family transcriptional regulator [Flavobacteriales bacterium]|nr:RecX family transcriptional regulator [Flavobacteriales bacterium]